MPLTADLITNEEIVKTYKEAAEDIAEMISKLELHVGHFEVIEDITLNDAGDLAFSGHDAIEALGKVLAACVIYVNEYEKNPFKKEK